MDRNAWRKGWGNATSLPAASCANTAWKNQTPLWTCRGAMWAFTTEMRSLLYLAATSRFSSSLNGIPARSITRFIDRVNLNSTPSVSNSKFKTVKWCCFLFFFLFFFFNSEASRVQTRRHQCVPNLYVIRCDGGVNAVTAACYGARVSNCSPALLLYRSGWQKVPFSAITWVSTHQLAIQLSLHVMNRGGEQWRSYWSCY